MNELITEIKSKYTREEIQEAFVRRTLDPELTLIGHSLSERLVTDTVACFLAYEYLVGSVMWGKV